MALIGVISCQTSPRGIDLDRWRTIAATDPRFHRPPARDIINPFTGKPTTHVSPDTDANILLDAVPVGAIAVAEEEQCELTVWAAEGRHEMVEAVARSVATELGGKYSAIP
jgi:hypothetical protein